MKKIIFICIVCFVISSGCIGPEGILKKAAKYESQQKYDLAEQQYLRVIVKFSNTEYSAEAMYKLGLIYKNIKQDYAQSQMWFNKVITNFPNSKFKLLSEVGILESPDYSGSIDGNKIVLGDVETRGKNMRFVIEYKSIDYNICIAYFKLLAGDKLVREEKKYYLKTGYEIQEFSAEPKKELIDARKYTVILKYPYIKNNSWETYKEGKKVRYTIIEDNIVLTLRNKVFKNCIKVAEKYESGHGIKYFYYAPNIGCIKITTASISQPVKEYPMLELLTEGGV